MKLQLLGGEGADPPRSHASNWTSLIEAAAVLDGCLSYRADIFDSLKFACRITLSGPFTDGAAVASELEVRRDRWIAEYEMRDRICAVGGPAFWADDVFSATPTYYSEESSPT